MDINNITLSTYRLEILDELNESFLNNEIDITHLDKELLRARELFKGIEKWETIIDVKTEKTNSEKSKSYRSSSIYYVLKSLRAIVDGHKCYKCKTDQKSLTLHHLHYNTYYREKLNDVKMLCWDCHKNFHKIQKTIHANYSNSRKGKKMKNDQLTMEKMALNLEKNRNKIVELVLTTSQAYQEKIFPNSKDHFGRRAETFLSKQWGMNEKQILDLKIKCGIAKSYKKINLNLRPFFSMVTVPKDLSKYSDDKIVQEINKKIDDIIKTFSAIHQPTPIVNTLPFVDEKFERQTINQSSNSQFLLTNLHLERLIASNESNINTTAQLAKMMEQQMSK
jgi:hypothetical protein